MLLPSCCYAMAYLPCRLVLTTRSPSSVPRKGQFSRNKPVEAEQETSLKKTDYCREAPSELCISEWVVTTSRLLLSRPNFRVLYRLAATSKAETTLRVINVAQRSSLSTRILAAYPLCPYGCRGQWKDFHRGTTVATARIFLASLQ